MIYHENSGRPGHRMIMDLLHIMKCKISKTTIHKYMNRELKLHSIVFRKRPGYTKGHAHAIFPNLLKRNFKAEKSNTIFCTDFTYIKMADGTMRYNCSIIDLFNRGIVASLNGKEMSAELAVKTLKKAIRNKRQNELIIHSDQGSQFTSKEFTDFCKRMNITQSMNKAGCPYDNAVMERYFNTLKNELIYHHSLRTDEELESKIYDFTFLWYNRKRPHSYNGGVPPMRVKRRA